MDAIKKGGRANRYQRNARHAHRAPGYGHHNNSLTRREAEAATLETVFVVVLLILAILACGLMEGTDLEEHARWEADLREQGAWVMW